MVWLHAVRKSVTLKPFLVCWCFRYFLFTNIINILAAKQQPIYNFLGTKFQSIHFLVRICYCYLERIYFLSLFLMYQFVYIYICSTHIVEQMVTFMVFNNILNSNSLYCDIEEICSRSNGPQRRCPNFIGSVAQF